MLTALRLEQLHRRIEMSEIVDLDGDGKVEEYEIGMFKKRMATQRRMAIVSLIAMIGTGTWIAFGMDAERLESMGSLLDLYFITLGGVVAAYMGAEAFASTQR